MVKEIERVSNYSGFHPRLSDPFLFILSATTPVVHTIYVFEDDMVVTSSDITLVEGVTEKLE